MPRPLPAHKARHPNRVRELRVAAGLTQEALGEKLGVTFSAIGKLERGQTRMHTEQAKALSAILGVHELELLLPISAEEHEILQILKSAAPDMRARIVQMVRMMAEPLPARQPARVA